jgi:hypothetical protein
VITDAGVVITRLTDLGGAHGHSQPGRITILESLAPADTAAALVHEFAHLCRGSGYVRVRPRVLTCTGGGPVQPHITLIQSRGSAFLMAAISS